MKRIIFMLLLVTTLMGCKKYEQPSEPVLFMGGGKWTFVDYDIIIINSASPVEIIKNDTICINSFNNQTFVSGGVLMSQNYKQTSISRRFIKNKTQWEFDGYHLYCEWINTPGGTTPSHEPFWVSYPNYLYTEYTRMSVLDQTIGLKTDYSFETNNRGVAPPNKLKLISPEIVTDLYYSNGSRDKAVTVKIILTFMR
jgi:hypothetical protein